jgi:hypothetical protein
MEECCEKIGESGPGRTFEVTVFTGPRSGLVFGSPSKPQHQQMPLQCSGVVGCCWLTTVCSEEEIPVSGPSHRSQCGGWTTTHTNIVHNSNTIRQDGVVIARSRLLMITLAEAGHQRLDAKGQWRNPLLCAGPFP